MPKIIIPALTMHPAQAAIDASPARFLPGHVLLSPFVAAAMLLPGLGGAVK